MADFPIINGKRYSWASVESKHDGINYTGIKSISYKQSLKSEKVLGHGIYPIGRTAGEYEAEAEVEWLIQDLMVLRKALAAKAPNASYAFQEFETLVQYDNGVDPVHTVKLVRCRFEDEDANPAQGGDATTEKIKLSVMWIEKDGLRMVSAEDAGR